MAGLVARAGLDCATRRRVVYRADRPLDACDGDFLPDAKRTLSEFSTLVVGALDHLKLTLGSQVEASFAIGGDEIVVAYGKLGGVAPQALVDAVEARLTMRFGAITYAPSPTREVTRRGARGS